MSEDEEERVDVVNDGRDEDEDEEDKDSDDDVVVVLDHTVASSY
jgi:hypothetical protein